MPQLDPTTFSPQLIWLAITFGLLYVVMARFALPRVTHVLEERKHRVEGDLAAAEKMKNESARLEADYQAMFQEARAKAAGFMRDQRIKAESTLEERRKEASAKADARFREAEKKILQAKAKALQDLDDVAAEACVAIVTKLSGQKAATKATRK